MTAELISTYGIVACFIGSSYVFLERNRWRKFSQGLKPLIYGTLIFFLVLLLCKIQLSSFSIDDLLNILKLKEFEVGISKLIILAYVLILIGIEICLVVFFKKFTKNS